MYAINRLLKDIEMQNAALFIGAGAARCYFMPAHQLPDGNEMKLGLYKYRYGLELDLEEYEKKFRDEFNVPGSGYMPPEMVWEKCLGEHGEKLTPYQKVLEDMFGKTKYMPPNYKFMAWLNLMDERKINQIITTNFDEKIEGAYKLLQYRGLFTDINVLTAGDDSDFMHFSEKLRNTRIIYKLHGTISRPFTIISSITDMNKGLSELKYNALKDIFKSNGLVIFVGYACNDKDIFEALKKISKDLHDVKIVWVKRSPKIKKNSNISKILSAFESTDNILPSESYEFFKKLFDKFVDRERISMPLIEHHINFMKNIVIKDTNDAVETGKKEPLPDVLYGEIVFPEICRKEVFKIINSFDMQRLRDIKQLSFAQYRYPGATHTRFSHSLGVAYLVSKALTNSNIEKKVDEADRKNTIYAALLHDVGHGPLGHVLDKFYDRLQKGNEHENFTRKFIDEGLMDLQEVLKDINMNVTDVKDRISFKSKNTEELKKCADKLYLSWLITDYALDLDRIDFLMRDLLMTQYKYQSKSPTSTQQHLSSQEHPCREILNDIITDFVSCLCIGTVDELDETDKDRFGFPENAKILYLNNQGKYNLEELLRFLLGLYIEMYTNVYYHDRISCAEAMMAKALHIAYEAGDIDRSRLYTFTDSELYAYLENLENDLIREIVYSVKHRRFFRPVVQFKLDLSKEISAVKIEEEIAKEFNLDQNVFKSQVIVNILRKRELKNLFIKREDKIISYPDLPQFEKELSDNIKGKIFIHPKSKLYEKEKNQKLVNLLKSIGIPPEVVLKDARERPPPQQPTLRKWF